MKARILELLKLNSLRVTKPLTQKSYDEHPPPFHMGASNTPPNPHPRGEVRGGLKTLNFRIRPVIFFPLRSKILLLK